MLVNRSTDTQAIDFNQTYAPSRSSISEHISRMSRNVAVLSVPLLIGATAMMMPVADGGPLTYYSCVFGCESLATLASGGPGAAFIGQCITACLPLFAAPFCP